MNTFISAKIRVLSFMAMVMIVYLHSYSLVPHYNAAGGNTLKGYNAFIQAFISDGVTRIAVPLFAAISGFLNFLKIEESLGSFLNKYKKRFGTIVVPYLFWSAWGILFFYLLQLVPQSHVFFNKQLIKDYPIQKLFSTLFLAPLPYQLWFLRDLIVLVYLSPAIYYSIKYLKIFTPLVFFVLWCIGYNFYVLSNETLFFFVMGAYIAVYHQENFIRSRFNSLSIVAAAMWVLAVTAKTINFYMGSTNFILYVVLLKSGILCGLFAVWYLYDYLLIKTDVTLYKYYSFFSFSFFLYAFHEPVMTFFKKASIAMLGKNEWGLFMIYLLVPVIVIALAITVASVIKSITPKFYGLITGGR